MPDTLFGLCILILLFLPGVIFVIQVDNRRPVRELSSLRELVSIAAIGALCDLTSLILFGILRALFPGETPNVGKIIRVGAVYFRLHAVSEAWWILGLLGFSCGLAYVLGRYQPRLAGAVVSGRITFNSAWWELFHLNPQSRIYVSCELQDGSYIAGYLLRYSTETDETPDRDLALAEPISYRPVGRQEATVLDKVGAIVISASQIKFLTVTYEQVS
jgi:Family of unknown function (DUF6338)